MKYILALISVLVLYSSALAQVVRILPESLKTNLDGSVSVRADLASIPIGARIDLALLKLTFNAEHSSKAQRLILSDKNGRRLSVTQLGPSAMSNHNEQEITFIVTKLIQEKLAEGSRSTLFRVNSAIELDHDLDLSETSVSYEFEVYYSTREL